MKVAPLLEMLGDWRAFLEITADVDADRLRQNERSGRPLGKESFVKRLETELSRTLPPQIPGPKKQGK